MLPIQQLLNRIRWDQRFRAGRFEIGYYDRRERRILMVPYERIQFPGSTPFLFEFNDEAGALRYVPFHRIRRVYRDGRIIWERKLAGEPASGTARR